MPGLHVIRRQWIPLIWVGVALPSASHAGSPPRFGATALPPELSLWLELIVNGAATGRIVAVTARENHYLVAAEDLRGAGIRLPPSMTGDIDVTHVPGIEAQYDQGTQRLLLRVPDDWLPQQRLGQESATARVKPESSLGAVFNYDLYVAGNDGGGYGSLWHEFRIFGAFGVVRGTGTYRTSFTGPGENGGYTRYDTNWSYVDEDNIRTYEAGDLVTRTLSWSSPVRIGGLQLSRDFAVRPDVVTYPLPTFSGTASVPTAVDLFVNGYRASGGSLQPGPFTLSNVPYINGAGEAVVVTTDAQGRQVSTSIPFYVASTLLRPGLSDYAFSVGSIRRDYGVRNFSYGTAVVDGSLRHGLTNWLTVETQAAFATSFQQGGLGGVLRLGNLGVLNASAALSRRGGETGSQVTLGYQYSNRHFNVTAGHMLSSKDYSDLSSLDLADYMAPRRQTQIAASTSLDRIGTIGGSYLETSRRDGRFRLLGLTYSRSLWRNSNVSASLNREMEREETTAMLQLIVPFGRAGSAVAGVDRQADGTIRERVNYSRSVPSDGGLGWTLAGSRGAGDGIQYQADMTWRTAFVQAQGGVYGSGRSRSAWADLSGSVVLMDGGAFATNRINDAFALVSTDGVAHVPVRYENQTVGITDRAGHLLIPWVAAYYGAKYEIDPLDLSADISTPVIEQRAAVKLGSGRLIRFPLYRLAAANVVLRDAAGAPLEAGTSIVANDGSVAYVGWGSTAYLQNLKPQNRMIATLPDGKSCSFSFPYDATDPGIAQIGPLTCR